MRVLFSAAEIAARVDALAAEIASTLPADFVMVGVLKGAWVFVADLVRALDRAGAGLEIEFMRLASYGLAKETSGAVQLLGDVPPDLAGRPILLVDDIVDTGRSIAYAAGRLREHGIGNLWTCALLDKPRNRGRDRFCRFHGRRRVRRRLRHRPRREISPPALHRHLGLDYYYGSHLSWSCPSGSNLTVGSPPDGSDDLVGGRRAWVCRCSVRQSA